MREEKPGPIATLASYIDSSSTVGCIEDASGSLALLCNDPALRRQADKNVLGRCVQLLTMSLADHVAMNILGALLNACADEPARQHLYELGAVIVLAPLLANSSKPALATRTAGVLARVGQFGSAAEALRKAGAVSPLLDGVMGVASDFQVAAVRMLAAMCTKDAGTVAAVAKSGLFKKLPGIIAQLDSTAVGNACMIVSQCAVEESHLKSLKGTVEPLVKVMHAAANDNRKSVAKNAAIALAKLAKDPANLEKIRDLHGIEIMFAYIKV